jgi:hypothetical protein
MRYREIAKPLRDATVLRADDSIATALEAFAGMDDDSAIVLVGPAPNDPRGFRKSRSGRILWAVKITREIEFFALTPIIPPRNFAY